MQLQKGINHVFVQILDLLEQLTANHYRCPIPILSNASIGQHVRHILELFLCLDAGYEKGIVNYEKRKRDLDIETDKDLATHLLLQIYENIGKENRSLKLETSYEEFSSETILIDTNYSRELVYNLEHTVHHMALIRIGINTIADIYLPEDFGVAASTVRHR